jgi:hypothetical protein
VGQTIGWHCFERMELAWVRSNLPECPSLAALFGSPKLFLQLIEKLTGQENRVLDQAFANFFFSFDAMNKGLQLLVGDDVDVADVEGAELMKESAEELQRTVVWKMVCRYENRSSRFMDFACANGIVEEVESATDALNGRATMRVVAKGGTLAGTRKQQRELDPRTLMKQKATQVDKQRVTP